MSEPHKFRKEDLIKILDNIINKTLGDVDSKNVFNRTVTSPKITGIAGDVVEQSVFGYPSDRDQRPDLDVDGVLTELKTTGIRYSKKEKNKYEAKEPMSITAVSPECITKEEFEDSNFWHKCEHMLFVYYLYDSLTTVVASEYSRFPIKGYEFHEFDEDEKATLKEDWEAVRDFLQYIQNNYEKPEIQYPRLSSELRNKLVYIDTAPKYPNPPRFRFKRSLVTTIVQNHFGERLEQLPGKYVGYDDVDSKCKELTNIYANKTVEELMELLNIEKNAKNISEQVIVKMFGGKAKKLSKIETFAKMSIIPKTVTLTKEGNRTEDMKLFSIDFDEWLDDDTEFEDSFIYDYFVNHQFMFILFEEPSEDASLKDNKFIGFKRVVFDEEINNIIYKTWYDIRQLVKTHKLVETYKFKSDGSLDLNKTGIPKTSINFPKAKEGIIFVRGSGVDSTKKPLTINGIKMYNQHIWIKGSYIANLIK